MSRMLPSCFQWCLYHRQEMTHYYLCLYQYVLASIKSLHMRTCFRGTCQSFQHLRWLKVIMPSLLCSAFGQTIEVRYSPSLHLLWILGMHDLISLLKGCGLTKYTSISWCHESITMLQTICNFEKQVDILISKNQVLQIWYLKHIELHKLPWVETHENLIPTKLNSNIIQFYCYIKQKRTL